MKFDLTTHAMDRIKEKVRTDITPDALLDILNSGRAILIGNPLTRANQRAAYLFFSHVDQQFLAAIVGVPDENRPGIVITLLSQDQLENDLGPLNMALYCRAAKMIMADAEYAAWFQANYGEKPKGLQLAIRHAIAGGGYKTSFIRYPHNDIDDLLGAGFLSLNTNLEFISWLNERLQKKGIDLSVVQDIGVRVALSGGADRGGEFFSLSSNQD